MKSKSTKITISLYCLIPPIQWLPIFVASKLGSIFPYVLTTTDSTSPFMGPNPLCKDTVYLPTLGSKQHVSEDEDGWISSQTSPELQGMLGFNPFNLKSFRQNGFIFPQFRCEKAKKNANNKNSRNHHQHPRKFTCLNPQNYGGERFKRCSFMTQVWRNLFRWTQPAGLKMVFQCFLMVVVCFFQQELSENTGDIYPQIIHFW